VRPWPTVRSDSTPVRAGRGTERQCGCRIVFPSAHHSGQLPGWVVGIQVHGNVLALGQNSTLIVGLCLEAPSAHRPDRLTEYGSIGNRLAHSARSAYVAGERPEWYSWQMEVLCQLRLHVYVQYGWLLDTEVLTD